MGEQPAGGEDAGANDHNRPAMIISDFRQIGKNGIQQMFTVCERLLTVCNTTECTTHSANNKTVKIIVATHAHYFKISFLRVKILFFHKGIYLQQRQNF